MSKPEEPAGGSLNFSLIIVRSVMVIVILIVGVGLMNALAAMRAKPEEALPDEVIAQVVGIEVHEEDFQATLFGYGTTKPHQVTQVIPEVVGRIVELHPNLEVGNIIPKGELLFRIDPTNYSIQLTQAQAALDSAEAALKQVEIQHQQDLAQLEVTKRMAAISEKDFQRFKNLYGDNQAESASAVENAELASIREQERLIQIQGRVDRFPADLKAAKANVLSATAQLERAQADLARTEIKSPFNARIVMKALEKEQLVSGNAPVLELADDSTLEVVVSMDSSEVAQWLSLTRDELKPQWFQRFNDYPVKLEWSVNPAVYSYTGMLDRVQKYNDLNRTFELVVRVRNSEQTENGENFPLTDGMFCRVYIPGKIAHNVIAIPREAVDSQNVVYLSVENKLKTQPVEIARVERNVVLVSKGLKAGYIILTKRPPAPIDGMKLIVKMQPNPAEELTGSSANDSLQPSFPISESPDLQGQNTSLPRL